MHLSRVGGALLCAAISQYIMLIRHFYVRDSQYRCSTQRGAPSAAAPAATLRPVVPSILTGCKAIEFPEPPTSTLTPSPTPTVALPVAPVYVPDSAPGPGLAVGATTVQTITPPCRYPISTP